MSLGEWNGGNQICLNEAILWSRRVTPDSVTTTSLDRIRKQSETLLLSVWTTRVTASHFNSLRSKKQIISRWNKTLFFLCSKGLSRKGNVNVVVTPQALGTNRISLLPFIATCAKKRFEEKWLLQSTPIVKSVALIIQWLQYIFKKLQHILGRYNYACFETPEQRWINTISCMQRGGLHSTSCVYFASWHCVGGNSVSCFSPLKTLCELPCKTFALGSKIKGSLWWLSPESALEETPD